jgi:two-component sensor histidine kinase
MPAIRSAGSARLPISTKSVARWTNATCWQKSWRRIKNIFAVVIGLASLKARNMPEHKPFADELTQVLRALNRAHEFVRPQEGPVQESLQGLLVALFAPYGELDGAPRVRLSGNDALVGSRAATPLALVFHELPTNSAKYGALSADAGYITLDIADAGEAIAMTWREHGGPEVTDTGKSGFGSRLVEMSVTGQLQGTWQRRFTREGMVADLTMANAALAD